MSRRHGNCSPYAPVLVLEGALEVWEPVGLIVHGQYGTSWSPLLAMKSAFKHCIRVSMPHCGAWGAGICPCATGRGVAFKPGLRLELVGMAT
jgi:hypothetical protein